MTFDVEILLRQNERVFTDRIDHDREPSEWTEADAETVLKNILAAISRRINPDSDLAPAINLRGMNWIVSPYKDGVVIAFEIHSASAVAGPFLIPQQRLEELVSRAIQAQVQSHATLH